MTESKSPQRGRRALLVQILLQTIVFGALFFGLAEVIARVGFGFRPVTPAYFIFDYHPRWGWSHRPDAEGRFVKLGFQQDIQINSRGLRERETPYEKPDGVTRVLVLGDSNVAALEVGADETWTRVTESILRERGHNVEFINAGHRGWGTDQSLLFLMDEGVKYEPDLVLYFWSGNDIDDNLTVHRPFRKYGKSYFDLDEAGKLTLQGVPVPRFAKADGIRIGLDGQPHPVEVPGGVHATLWVRDNVITVSAFATAMVYAIAKLPGGQSNVASHGTFGDFQGGDPRVVEPGPDNYSFRLTLALIREMQRVSAENGARFYMLGNPGPGEWPDLLRDEAGMPRLMVYERYRESVPDMSLTRVPMDPHWNALGQRYYSKTLADTLVESGLLTGRSPAAGVGTPE